jgi:hypothetical protein
MTPTTTSGAPWRELTVGLLLPEAAFGAAVGIDTLLTDPELHYTAAPASSRLLLLPRAGTFSRLLLVWENLPEIGVFTAAAMTIAPMLPEQIARLETWMRDVAVVLHANRDRIREASERVVRDATLGLASSLPSTDAPRSHVVAAAIGTNVAGPSPDTPFGIVDIRAENPEPDSSTSEADQVVRFVQRATDLELGRRITRRSDSEIHAVALVPALAGVTPSQLADWYDQHIAREVLFDDVWQVYVHLVAGLDAPASIRDFG